MSVENTGLFLQGTPPTLEPSDSVQLREQSSAAQDQLAQLLVRAADGDEAAFAAVYDATSSMVFGMAHSVFSDLSQAETVTHDVYVTAWMSASTFDPSHHTSGAWLRSITRRNIALVLARQLRRSWSEEG